MDAKDCKYAGVGRVILLRVDGEEMLVRYAEVQQLAIKQRTGVEPVHIQM